VFVRVHFYISFTVIIQCLERIGNTVGVDIISPKGFSLISMF